MKKQKTQKALVSILALLMVAAMILPMVSMVFGQ